MKRIYESLMTDLTVPSIVELSDSQTDDLFNLVDLGRNDVFYDLGSGTGKVVINAYKKRNVRKAIGIEHNKKYYDISKKRTKEISNLDLDKNIDFWHGDYSEHNEDKYHFDILMQQ